MFAKVLIGLLAVTIDPALAQSDNDANIVRQPKSVLWFSVRRRKREREGRIL